MHILFLTDNFPPEVNAPASRTFEHAREWVKSGHRVTIVTGAPNFPDGRVFEGYRNRLHARETMDGIEVIRVWSYITANEGFLRRSLDYASYMASATVAAPFVRGADIVVATSPQFFTAVAGYLVSRLLRKPFVFELRDLWPESIRAVGAMRSGPALAALQRLELFLYRKAVAIVPVTHAFRRNLISRGINGDKIHVVTNGADLSRFKPMAKDAVLAAKLGLTGNFTAGYVGTHGMAHALDTLLDAAALLKRDPDGRKIRLVLVGGGACKAQLVSRAAREGLDNVIFLDSVPKSEVVRHWSILDASIIHLKRAQVFTTVIPSKLFESMAMGLAVLHGVEGESAGIVEHHRAGLLFEPENAGQLAARLLQLAGDAALRNQLGANGVTAAAHYDRPVLAADMLRILQSAARHAQAA